MSGVAEMYEVVFTHKSCPYSEKRYLVPAYNPCEAEFDALKQFDGNRKDYLQPEVKLWSPKTHT